MEEKSKIKLSFGEVIRKERLKYNADIDKLSKATSIHPDYIYMLEEHMQRPNDPFTNDKLLRALKYERDTPAYKKYMQLAEYTVKNWIFMYENKETSIKDKFKYKPSTKVLKKKTAMMTKSIT